MTSRYTPACTCQALHPGIYDPHMRSIDDATEDSDQYVEVEEYEMALKRIAQLEATLRGILALADISKPVDADALTAAVRRGWVALQSETPVRAHSKSEYKRLSALGVECAPPDWLGENGGRSRGEPPHCASCSCGLTTETVSLGGQNFIPGQWREVGEHHLQSCPMVRSSDNGPCTCYPAETSVAPLAGADQLCHLCGNVHDLMSACPPKETACTCDSTLVTDTSNHQPHCPRYVAETPAKPPYWVRTFWSPDKKYLVTVHVTGGKAVNIIGFQDDDGDEWEPASDQQNMEEGWICQACGRNNGRSLQCLNRECPSFAPKQETSAKPLTRYEQARVLDDAFGIDGSASKTGDKP
jgi:hypothetical protein